MDKTHLHDLALEVSRETGFVCGNEIYRGSYYSKDFVRNIIFEGVYEGRPAVLKIYDDPRLTDEPVSQIAFNKVNKSKVLRAPKVYAHKIISTQRGWLIMEKLPSSGSFFSKPVNDKKEFAQIYFEYRINFPTSPTRPLTLVENLSADEYHVFRINRWLELAAKKEAEIVLSGDKPILAVNDFIPRFEKALALIRREFKKRKMLWCHGHFKPHELFKMPDNSYYLTDFGHSRLYPEGYEFGFIIWADWLVSADWKMNYKDWKKGVDDWIKVLRPIADKLKVKNFNFLIKASLAERALGAILADICTGDKPREEKEKRIALLYKLLDEIV